jgi:TRAP-type C4-dicarboxylate transport system permease small subunit
MSLKHALNKTLEWMVIVSMVLLTLDVLWGVLSRYVLGAQTRWTEELATALMIWVALLGAALAFGERAHLGVDYFVKKLDPAAQRWTDALVHALVLAFVTSVMLYGGSVLVTKTLQAGQVLPALGWKKGYVYMAVPISGVFMVVYALEGIVESLTGEKKSET